MSVYADHSVAGIDESAGLAVADDPDDEDASDNYGPFKALCEQKLHEAFPGMVHNVRAGLIVGPYDNSGRFSYWVESMLNGGEVLAPEPKDQPVQFIDVRDLAEWILLAAEQGIVGTFNACNSPGAYTMQSMLVEMCEGVAGDTDLCWVGEKFLVDRGVAPWTDLPLWLPPTSRPTHVGFMSRDNSRAVSHGLTIRPLAETVSATRAWLNDRDGPAEHKEFGNPVTPAGLTTDREQALLAAWKAQQR
jgi:2'-hydroxyisoflavone reductase